jgi:hypothetical protein
MAMVDKAIFIWRFDYELADDRNTSWSAHIAGYNEEQCRDYLHKIVGAGARIITISQVCRLDAITDEFRKLIVSAASPIKKGPGRPPKRK